MASKKSSRKPASKKATPKKAKNTRGGVNKSAFIREQPTTKSAKDVVAAGKARGIALTEGFVYNVRASVKAKRKTAGAKQGPGRSKAVLSSDEGSFRALVVNLGTARAKALVDEVESKLAAVIAGK